MDSKSDKKHCKPAKPEQAEGLTVPGPLTPEQIKASQERARNANPHEKQADTQAEGLLAPGERWRVVALELERDAPVDWSYEREWRLAGDLALPAGRAVALVESWRDADEIYDRFQGQPPCAGVIPLRELFGTS